MGGKARVTDLEEQQRLLENCVLDEVEGLSDRAVAPSIRSATTSRNLGEAQPQPAPSLSSSSVSRGARGPAPAFFWCWWRFSRCIRPRGTLDEEMETDTYSDVAL